MSSMAGFLSGMAGGLNTGMQINERNAQNPQRERDILSILGIRPHAPERNHDMKLNELPAGGVPQPAANSQTSGGPNRRLSPSQAMPGNETVGSPQAARQSGPTRLITAKGAIDPKLDGYIASYAEKYGENPDFFRRLSEIESSGGTRLKNEDSTASGPWQFVEGTARDYKLADPFDFDTSTDAVMRLTADNRKGLTNALGREPTYGELYLAHQQGMGGAGALLANPDATAIDALTPVYDGSRRKARAAVLNNGGTADMKAADFAAKWTKKFDAPAEDERFASVRRAMGR